MAKTSRKKLKEDRNKILRSLVKDSNQNLDVLASTNNCSRQKIWRIIKELEKTVIWGYTVVFSKEAIEMNSYILTIKFNNELSNSPHRMEKIQQTISRELEKNVKDVHLDSFFYVHGPYDFILRITAKNIRKAVKVKKFIFDGIGEIIKDITISEVLFPLVEGSIKNPQIEKFKTFFED